MFSRDPQGSEQLKVDIIYDYVSNEKGDVIYRDLFLISENGRMRIFHKMEVIISNAPFSSPFSSLAIIRQASVKESK